ncbi:hypothetical protein N9173_01275 [bacterium]|nr:hypothetical protein [bacterium]
MSRHSASGNMIGETGVILLILSAVKNDYRIEELVSQSANMVVYRASGKDGQIFALTRLVLSDDIAESLTAEHFETALAQLKDLEHPCLRSVLDGGCDEIDHQPWLVSQWWEGETLEDRLADATFDDSDLHRLQGLAQDRHSRELTFYCAKSVWAHRCGSSGALSRASESINREH